MTTTINFSGWTKATGDLKPGQQAVFLDFLNLVKDGKAHLVHGADYRDGKPCLVNGVATMLSHSSVSPTQMFPSVVGEFDRTCKAMAAVGLEGDLEGYVSPLMAEFLIRNFGEVKDIEVSEPVEKKVEDGPYIEPTDAQMVSFLTAMSAPGPEAIVDADNTDADVDYTRAFVNVKSHPSA